MQSRPQSCANNIAEARMRTQTKSEINEKLYTKIKKNCDSYCHFFQNLKKNKFLSKKLLFGSSNKVQALGLDSITFLTFSHN